MVIRHPVARLTAGGRTLTSAEGAIARLDVRLSSDGAHDALRLVLWSTSRLADVAPDDRLALAVGESGDEADVWGGAVTRTEGGDGRILIDALAHTAPLSRERRSQSWEDQTVEQIVRDLAGTVEIDEVDASLRLPWFAVDAQRPVWTHLRELAALVGAELGSSADGAARFVPVAANPNHHRLRRGADLVRWQLSQQVLAESRGARAYAAASEAGAAQWHWLTGGGASSARGGSIATLAGALRTQDAADAAATARASRRARRLYQGTVVTTGSPTIRPGDSVTLGDVVAAPTERWRVRTVHHRLDGAHGLSTTLHVEGGDG